MNRPVARNSIGGFTLVEILVGLTLGLIAIVVMLQVFAVFESQKRSTTTGSDAQTTGLLSLYSLEREVRMAGYGLVYNNPINDTTYQGQIFCNRALYRDSITNAARVDVLQPVLIENAANGNSDRITVTFASSSFAAAPAVLDVDVPDKTYPLVIRNAPVNDLGSSAVFQTNDIVMLATPQAFSTGTPALVQCTLLVITAVTPGGTNTTLAPQLLTSLGTALSAAASDDYAASVTPPSLVAKLGSLTAGQPAFIRNEYSVVTNELRVRNLTTAGVNPATSIGEGVVDLQAQYGVVELACADAGANLDRCNSVAPKALGAVVPGLPTNSGWTNPTGAWANPAPADATRIKAIRISVITRSSQRERDPATNNCLPFDGTTTVPNNTTKCRAWANDTNAPELPWTGTADWNDNGRFFRYRTYETVIPLRNMLWGNT